MDFQISLVKGLKGLAVVLVSAVAASLVSGDFVSQTLEVVKTALSAVPIVGSVLAPAVGSAVVALFAGVSVSILNAIKHWND